MLDWLRLLLMVFYAPGRALREVRDRATLAPAGLLALLSFGSFLTLLTFLYLRDIINPLTPKFLLLLLFQSAGCLLFVAFIFAPFAIVMQNIMDRRGSIRLVMQQDFSALVAAIFLSWAAASLISILLVLAGHYSGVLDAMGRDTYQSLMAQKDQILATNQRAPGVAEFFTIITPAASSAIIGLMLMLAVFGLWAIAALRIVFRISLGRAVLIVVVSAIVLIPAFKYLQPILSMILASPFLLLMLFFLLRGYIGELTRQQRARASFKQNLEAATLNPADASAHYNLGLIHQQRGELDAARERFERAIQIDEEEVDAHYQLGRIARQQKRWGDAIKHFEQVVSRDQSHSQYEIWREVGSTYLSAGQFEDARGVLERFLEHRESDPEGLYLMGRAEAGLGHNSEATSMMEA
ncbi:MAG TPA: tetratricopeptide repeat protein, partial [Pyrinomonadaceae bacterium]|nr:tetratricopeptide repeat protein [Pyrinomonadaceae bacterium]